MSWLKRLLGAPQTPTQPASTTPELPTAEEMNFVIPAFGQLMERNAGQLGTVFDEAMLPKSKARLEFVLFCAIGVVESEDEAQQLAAGLLHIADYQPNVGTVPVTQLPALPTLGSPSSPEAIRAAAEAVSAHAVTSRYSAFEMRVQQDLERLNGMADKALAARAARLKHRSGR
ncbi:MULTISPECIES: hypothetical protein [Roseomonadaceae]|uniref:Uncharacterized protein n=1 Tax=Falsiroseomonas oleicola TaxID=2801474 RepID=A0ABS6HD65_9PROT|nr:hypothetical protein [Roseomonas oleicola]MBU8545757.1 hypothetical protein [Roseomonas oleicola]